MKKTILFGILLFSIAIVNAAPTVQEWCFTYANGYELCGERMIIGNDFTDGAGNIHYNYKAITKTDLYLPTGELCNSELYHTRHNYLLTEDFEFKMRIHAYDYSPGINFADCSFDWSLVIKRYNDEGLQFCKGITC